MQAARQQAGSTNIGTGNDNMPETHQSFQEGMQRRVLKEEKKDRLERKLAQIKYIHINNSTDGILTYD